MLYNISKDFDLVDPTVLKAGDNVYVLDQCNLYDMYKGKIISIKNSLINVSYPDFDNEAETVPIERILPVTPKNQSIYIAQENIRSQRNRIYSDLYTTNKPTEQNVKLTSTHKYSIGEVVFVEEEKENKETEYKQLSEGIIINDFSNMYLIEFPDQNNIRKNIKYEHILPNTEFNRKKYIRQEIARYESDPILPQCEIDSIGIMPFVVNDIFQDELLI